MKLGVYFTSIRACINTELNRRKSAIKDALIDSIKFDNTPRDEEWLQFTKYYFDTTKSEPEYIVAVLKKFIQQVKIKINHAACDKNLDVGLHIMPVIYGKTDFVENIFCLPFTEIIQRPNMAHNIEKHTGEIWDNPIFSLKNIETIKQKQYIESNGS